MIALNLTGIDPIKALFWSAVINGIVAGPVMAVMLHMASNPLVMGDLPVPPWLRRTGWVAAIVMLACAAGLFATWGSG